MGLLGGLFGANDETWKRQRRIVMPGFDPTTVKRYHPALQRVARRLSLRWKQAAQTIGLIDLQSDLMHYTVDAIAGLAFGAEVNTLQSDEDVIQMHLNRIFPAVFARVFAPLPTWRWFPSRQPAPRAERAKVQRRGRWFHRPGSCPPECQPVAADAAWQSAGGHAGGCRRARQPARF